MLLFDVPTTRMANFSEYTRGTRSAARTVAARAIRTERTRIIAKVSAAGPCFERCVVIEAASLQVFQVRSPSLRAQICEKKRTDHEPFDAQWLKWSEILKTSGGDTTYLLIPVSAFKFDRKSSALGATCIRKQHRNCNNIAQKGPQLDLKCL